VRACTRLVKFYNDKNVLIKTHPRSKVKGQWVTDWNDIPKHKRDYVFQTAEQLISLAGEVGKHVQSVIEQIVQPILSEGKKRKSNALLRLADEYSATRLNAACKRALAHNNINYKCIERILKKNLDKEPLTSENRTIQLEGAFLHKPTDFSIQ